MKSAKQNEIKNIMDYETFEGVKDKGKEMIESRYVITQKEQHDGQKQNCKA